MIEPSRCGLVGVIGLIGLPLMMAISSSVGLAGFFPQDSSRIRLYDGKTLEGWKQVATYKAGTVKVEDGAVVLDAGGPMTAIVTTRADLPKSDYELSFEARRTTGSDFFAAATFPVGGSFVTLVNGGWGGSVTGLSCLNGADASENDSRRFVKFENGTWYKFRVHVTGSVIRCWINDKETFAVNHQDVQLKTRIETRPCEPLGFASYRSTGVIRLIEVRPLNPAEIQANNKSAEP